MNKGKLILWEMVLLIGLMLTGCAGNYGSQGHSDHPYYDYGRRNHGSPYYHEYRGGW